MSEITVKRDEYLWATKYRPSKVRECIMAQEYKDLFQTYVDKGELPMLLLSSPPGQGKTTMAYALCEEIGSDALFINASLENGIDVLRNKIQQFASTVSMEGGAKVVILDEADQLNCLEENETLRIGTVGNWEPVPLNQLEQGKDYPVVSFNIETGEFEDDIGAIVSDSIEELYLVELECGRTVKVTADHPFIVSSDSGFVECKVSDDSLKIGASVVVESSTSKVKSITKIGSGRVINLNVEKNHTFVTGNGIVTHNCNSIQPALRSFLETFSKNCRFILTCNYPNKLIEPLRSRLTHIDFKISAEEKPKLLAQMYGRVCEILKLEGIEYDKKVVAQFVGKYFPDNRKILNELQRYSISGRIDSGILVNEVEDSFGALIASLKGKDYRAMREWVAKNGDMDIAVLVKTLYNMSNEKVKPQSIPQLVLTLADYQYKAAFAADPEVNIAAMMTELMVNVEFL